MVEKRFTPRYYTELYLEHFAAFFARLAEGQEAEANHELNRMRNLDFEAEQLLNCDALRRYRRRRSELVQLFHGKLKHALRDQIEKINMARAEELIAKLAAESPATSSRNFRK